MHQGPWKPIAAFTILIILSAALAGCGDAGGDGDDDRIVLVASTSIIGALVQEVGGEHLDIETLIDSNVDPHSFEMTPGDIRTLAEADLVLINGFGLDDYLIDDVENVGDGAKVVVVTVGIEPRGAGDADHSEHDHSDVDPHVWQDPLRVKIMVANIADALADVDPDNAQEYRDNAEAYQETLDETHEQIQGLIDEIPAERRKIVTNHDAFGYFADRYGLQIVGTVIPGSSSDADPSAGDIANLIELIEENKVTAIFAEALIDPKVAEALASDAGVRIVYGLYSDQVGEAGSGVETVHGMLLANAEKISEALRE